jgi:hypothetical protein
MEKLAVRLTGVVYESTGYVPPDQKKVIKLVAQFPIEEIEKAFREFIEIKTEGERLSAVRLFFDGGAAGIIAAQSVRTPGTMEVRR